MSILGFIGTCLGLGAMVKESAQYSARQQRIIEDAQSRGVPYCDDVHGGYIYLPTGEECFLLYDGIKGCHYLKNKKNGRRVFDIEEWQKEQKRSEEFAESRKSNKKYCEWVHVRIDPLYEEAPRDMVMNINTAELGVLCVSHADREDSYFIDKVEIYQMKINNIRSKYTYRIDNSDRQYITKEEYEKYDAWENRIYAALPADFYDRKMILRRYL